MNRMLTIRVAIALTTAFALPITIAPPAAAQSMATNPPVEIKNNSGETRRICMHKPKKLTLFAIGCITLKKGERIYWNRKGVFTTFKVKIYKKRKLIDKYLYARDLPADTGKIIIGTGGRFGFSRFKNILPKYTLRACNGRFDDPIWLSVGLDTSTALVTSGWWKIERGTCVSVPVSKRLKEKWNIPYRDVPRIYYYARTHGEKPLFWRKGSNSQMMCINHNKKFHVKTIRTANCIDGLVKEEFRYYTLPKPGQAIIRLNF